MRDYITMDKAPSLKVIYDDRLAPNKYKKSKKV